MDLDGRQKDLELRERIAYFGYVFQMKGDRCRVYNPAYAVRREGRYDEYHRGEEPKIASLFWMLKKPEIGQKVDYHKNGELEIRWSKLNDLTPIGKFGVDNDFQESGPCKFQELDEFEKSLSSEKLIRIARKVYLEFLEKRTGIRSVDSLFRTGHIDAYKNRKEIELELLLEKYKGLSEETEESTTERKKRTRETSTYAPDTVGSSATPLRPDDIGQIWACTLQ